MDRVDIERCWFPVACVTSDTTSVPMIAAPFPNTS